MATKITPPKLNNDTPYTEWKNRLQVWKTVYGCAKKGQAIALLQSLNKNKKAEKGVSQLTVKDLNINHGLEKLFEKTRFYI